MKIKRILALLLAAVMVFAFIAACAPTGDPAPADPTPTPEATPTPTPAPPDAPPEDPPEVGERDVLLARAAAMPDPTGYIVIRASVAPDQNIFTAYWTNMASNAQARMAMSGQETISRNEYGQFFPNPIVMVDGAWPEIYDDAEGNRTYTFTIYTDNQFSDGTFIDASHYAGGLAFMTSPQFAALVPASWDAEEAVGREAWMSGEASTFAGVRLLSDNQFSVTVYAEHVPYVWEAAMYMGVGPLPIHALGVEVHDDGDGVYITAPGGAELTFEAVHLAIMGGDVQNIYATDEDGEYVYDDDGERIVIGQMGDGWRFNPRVSAGPYVFESQGDGRKTIVANPYFNSTWDGYRPRIERVIWEYVPVPTTVDALAEGRVHMIAGTILGDIIEEGFARLVDVDNPTHTFNAYADHGQSMIQFHVDHGPTQFREVRAAISFMIDRFEFAEVFGRGFASPLQIPASMAEWFTVAALERGLNDQIIIYDLNMEEAIRLLEEGGWVYDANGNPYDGTGYRHKMVDGELMELHIKWVSAAAPRPLREALLLQLEDRMEYVGMRMTLDQDARWGAILSSADQEYHMIDVNVGFGIPFRRWWNVDPATGPAQNWANMDWPETLALANAMRELDITTEEGQYDFVTAFMALMVNQNYMLDTIPLTSLTAHDFIPPWLGNWVGTGLWSDGMAIVRAYDTRN